MGGVGRRDLPGHPWPPGTASPHHMRFCALFRQEAMKLPRSTPEERDRWAPKVGSTAGAWEGPQFH